jgi:hypothetical protein
VVPPGTTATLPVRSNKEFCIEKILGPVRKLGNSIGGLKERVTGPNSTHLCGKNDEIELINSQFKL